jgi:transposase
MIRRGELTDEAWAWVEPLLPEGGRRGGRWREHRTVTNGILWKLRTGAPWRDLPERYGPWQICYDRFVRWRRDGTWEHLLTHAQTRLDAVWKIEWEVSADSTVVRAHQHAAGARKELGPWGRKRGRLSAPDEALGHSRGGFSTKVHLACDGRGRPLSVLVTAGQRNEAPELGDLLDGIRLARPGGAGRPRKRPGRLLADRGYSHASCRSLLRRRGIPHIIPEREDQRERRRRGRPPEFDREAYRRRNVVERCVNRLKQWRGVATRYEKRAVNYRAMVIIASLMIWLTA